MGRWPNLKRPVYLSEKIQWLKLHDKNELYPFLVDKYSVRKYIADKIGEEYLIPIYGVWDNAKKINWESLPDRFVLKCTNGSHTNIICKDKAKLDYKKTIRTLNRWLRSNSTYYYGREWPYKKAVPKIIAEKYIESKKEGGIQDYKFMCFHGVPDNVMICSDRETGKVRFDHFDRQWNFLKYQYVDENKGQNYSIDKPSKIEEMFQIAEILCKEFPFVRVDLYCECGKIFFGELTFYPTSGFDIDFTEETDRLLGSKIHLDKWPSKCIK